MPQSEPGKQPPDSRVPPVRAGHLLLAGELGLLCLLLGAALWLRCGDVGLQYISDDDMRMLVPALDILNGTWLPAWGHAVGPIHYGAVNLYLYALLIALSWRPGVILALGAAVHILGVLGVWAAARERGASVAAFVAAGLLSAHPWAIAAARNLGTTYFAVPFVGLALWGLCRSGSARLERARHGPLIGLTGASLAALSHPTGMVVGGVIGLGCCVRGARRPGLRRPLLGALGLNGLLWAPYLWQELGQRMEGLRTAARVVGAGAETAPIEASIGGTQFFSDVGWLQALATNAPTTAEALSQLAAGQPEWLFPLVLFVGLMLVTGTLQAAGREGATDVAWAGAATLALAIALHRLERSAGYAYDHHLQTALPTAAFCVGWAVQQAVDVIQPRRWRARRGENRPPLSNAVLGLSAALFVLWLQPGADRERKERQQETLVAGIAVWGRADQVAWHIARDMEDREGCLGLAVLEVPNQVNPYDAAKHALPLLLVRNGLSQRRMPWSRECQRPGSRRPVYLVSMGPTEWDHQQLRDAPEPLEALLQSEIGSATMRVSVFSDQGSFSSWLSAHCDDRLRQARASYLDGGNAWQWWDTDIGVPWDADGWRTTCIEQEGTP